MKYKFSIINFQLSIIFCFVQAQAQDRVTYGYDAAGNRISRVIDFASQPRSAEEPVEQKVYSEMLKDFSVKIYPNPTNGYLRVEILQLPEDQTATLRIYSASGNLILQKTGVRESENLDISAQPPGIYLLKIASEDSSTEWKIIKK